MVEFVHGHSFRCGRSGGLHVKQACPCVKWVRETSLNRRARSHTTSSTWPQIDIEYAHTIMRTVNVSRRSKVFFTDPNARIGQCIDWRARHCMLLRLVQKIEGACASSEAFPSELRKVNEFSKEKGQWRSSGKRPIGRIIRLQQHHYFSRMALPGWHYS